MEPQLVFRSKVNDNESRDYHPMRGLTSNRPYDVILNGRIYSNEINLSVICGQKYSNAFYSFQIINRVEFLVFQLTYPIDALKDDPIFHASVGFQAQLLS